MLLGDANDFQEYARDYYAVSSDQPRLKNVTVISDDLKKVSIENEQTYKIVEEEERKVKSSIKPLNVTITNPEAPVVYFIMNEILNGSVFGKKDVFIRLYADAKTSNLDGIRMEIEDLSSSKLRNIKIATTLEEAFTNCDYALLFDELSKTKESSNSYYNPYIHLAKEIDKYAKPSCKILISPFISRSETYALVNVFARYLKTIDAKKNLIGNSLYDEMLAKAILAHRLRINPAYVKNVLVIGQSLKDSFYIDLTYGKITDYDGAVWAKTETHWLNLVNMLADKDWIRKEFMNLVHDRGKWEFLLKLTLKIYS